MSLQHRALGQTGIQVSCVGLGTVKIGRNQEVKYPEDFSLPQDGEVQALLAQAKDLGINLLDTAPAYGSSEQRLGRLLRERDSWVLCTKVGEEFTVGKSHYDFSAEHTQYSVERSLRDLNTDYLDIVLVHSDGRDSQIIESTDCLETLGKLKDRGLIKAIGMSTKTVEGGIKALDLLDLVMVTYNPSTREEEAVIDYAYQQNKGVLIKKALNSGHDCVDEKSAADKMKFALARDGVSSVIVGTINPQHLAENVKAALS